MGIEIHTLKLGDMDNLNYVLVDAATRNACVVDPAWDVDALLNTVHAADANLTQIWITHAHADHVNALRPMLARQAVPVFISGIEKDFWRQCPDSAKPVSDGEHTRLGESDVEWILTPGHSPGSACFRLKGQDGEDHLIAGDTLFVYGCGHCRMPGADASALFDSLHRLKIQLRPRTVIHPGHDYGITTTAGFAEQLQGNPFLMIDDREDFIRYRTQLHQRSMPYAAVEPSALAEVLER